MATSVDQAAAAAAAQGMYIDKQQYEAMEQKLYKAVECKLEQSGVMAALKAQLRADIFAAMVEPSPGEQASTAERCRKLPHGEEALGLVVDYLASVGLTRVLCVLAPDVGLEDERVHPDVVLAPQTRSKLRDDVGLPAVPSKIPLLCELLEHRQTAGPVPKLDPTLSLSSSMPLPASTAAKLEAARAAALEHVRQAEDSYSASASFEEASISPRASYGDASFESESPRASPRTLSPRVSPSPSPEPAALPRRPDDSDASIEDEVEAASASEDSMFGGGGLGGASGVRGSEDSMFGGGGDANADAPARGAVDASEDSMFGAAGAAPARGGADDDAAPPRPRADDQSESASASDSSGDVSFAEDSADEAPAPARRPQTIDALFDSDGSDAAPERPLPPPPRRTFPPPAAPPRPPAAPSSFPTLPGMVAAPAADDGDDPFPGLAPGPDEDDNVSSRTGASSRTGTTATTAAARHDDVF
jgi:hypothetical protein